MIKSPGINQNGGAGGNPGGSAGQLQYNNSGAFGGTDFFYYDPVALAVTLGSATNINPTFIADPNVQIYGTVGNLLPVVSSSSPNMSGYAGAGSKIAAGVQIAAGYLAFELGGVFPGTTVLQGSNVAGNTNRGGGPLLIMSGSGFATNAAGTAGDITISCGGPNWQVTTSGNQITDYSLTSGGSGYPDGLWFDFSNDFQSFEIFDPTNTVPGYFTVQWVRVEGGEVVELGPIFDSGQPGNANIGDVLSLGFFQPYPGYAGTPTPATVTVAGVGSGYTGQKANINLSPGGSGFFTFENGTLFLPGSVGAIADSGSSLGTAGQVFTSQGPGTGSVWAPAYLSDFFTSDEAGTVTIGSSTVLVPTLQMQSDVTAAAGLLAITAGNIQQTPTNSGGIPNLVLAGQGGVTADTLDTVSPASISFEVPAIVSGETTQGGKTIITCAGATNTSGASAVGGDLVIFTGFAASSTTDVSLSNITVDLSGQNLAPGNAAPIAFTITDGGSGYPDGVWIDPTTWGLFEFGGTGSQYAQFSSITVVGGSIVALGPINYAKGTAVIGDVLTEEYFQPYGTFDPSGITSHATITATAISGTISEGIFVISLGGALGGYEISGIDGSLSLPNGGGGVGLAGQALTSQGTGLPPLWEFPSSPIISRDTVTTGGSLTIADGVTLESLRAAGTLATLTVTMPANPLPDQQVAIVCNFAVTAFTLSANAGQTRENPPAALIAGSQVIYIWDLSTTNWERIQ